MKEKSVIEVKLGIVTGSVALLPIGSGLTSLVLRFRVIGVGIKRSRIRKKKIIFENMIVDFVTDL